MPSDRRLRGDRAPELFTPLAFNQDNGLFLLDDESLGFGFLCRPLTGADAGDAERLSVLINQDWPAQTLIQVALWSSPDIDAQLARMLMLRVDTDDELLREATQARIRFLREGTNRPITTASETRVRNLVIVVTVQIPIAQGLPTDSEIKRAEQRRTATEQMLDTAGLRPLALVADGLVRLMSTLLNWGDQAAWRTQIEPECDPERFIRDQFLDYGNAIEVSADHLKVSRRRVHTLSAKRLPERMSFGMAMRYFGDPLSGTRGIPQHALIALNIFLPDQDATRRGITRKRQWITNVATSKLARFTPEVYERHRDLEALTAALDQGQRPVQCYLGMALIAEEDAAPKAVSNAITYWRELGFLLMEDHYYTLPLFLNLLPFGADRRAVRDSMRYRTMAASHACALMPVFGDWKGTGTPVVSLVSRSGQLMQLDLFESTTNYNAVIAASSGSGKSFFANELIASYLSTGAQIWVLDVGRSYEKLCETLNGQFIAFTPEARLCINPFELVGNWNEEADVIAAIVTAMAAPTEPLGDYKTAALKRCLKGLWDTQAQELTIDQVAEALLADGDARVRDIGQQLFPFTTQGEYGAFFNGRNTVHFDQAFVVLELEELKGRKHLQQVVLLILIYQIQQTMYLGDRQRRKLCFIDEAWDLLTEGDVARFIEHGYRRFRKYNGAAVTITQSLADLYRTEASRAIADNSANSFLLAQPAQTIDRLLADNRLPMPEAAAEMLKTVHTVPGAYSEIMLWTSVGAGIGRLVVDPFRRLLYSTNPREVAAIDRLRAQGLSVVDAIRRLMEHPA